ASAGGGAAGGSGGVTGNDPCGEGFAGAGAGVGPKAPTVVRADARAIPPPTNPAPAQNRWGSSAPLMQQSHQPTCTDNGLVQKAIQAPAAAGGDDVSHGSR
ncbi:unnamed protein product, partial [Laminaria digitata]